MKRLLLGLLLACAFALPAGAQGATVVTTCGTLPQAYSAGSTRNPTVDVNGNTCTDTGGSGATQDINIKQVGGATTQTGHGTAAGTLRVELPTDGTGVVGLNAGTNVIGKVDIDTAMTGLTPVVSTSAEATRVLKSSAGSLWAVYATNLTATPGFLQVFNLTAAPADGAVTPIECVPLPANGNASLSFNPGPPGTYSTGISVAVSSATTCFTKTTGVITAFLRGSVQ